MIRPLESYKPWLLWAHDPCPEGGWHVESQHDTEAEAIEAAKKLDAEKEKKFLGMVEHIKKRGNREPWKRSNECYDGCMITPRPTFMIPVDTKGKE